MQSHHSIVHPLPPGDHTAAFSGDPLGWLPAGSRPAVPPRHRVELTTGRLRRPVELEVGPVWVLDHDRWRSVSWSPLPHDADPLPVDQLLPRFDGELGLLAPGGDRRDQLLVLVGASTPPLGLAGQVLDRVLLHRVAERTISRLVDDVVAGLTGATTALASAGA